MDSFHKFRDGVLVGFSLANPLVTGNISLIQFPLYDHVCCLPVSQEAAPEEAGGFGCGYNINI